MGIKPYNSTSSWQPVIQEKESTGCPSYHKRFAKLRNYLVEAIDHRIKAVKTEPNKQNFRRAC